MKKIYALATVLPVLIFFLAIEGCNYGKEEKCDSLSAINASLQRQLDSLELSCDTLGLGALTNKIDAQAKYRKIKPWLRSKVYTLCIRVSFSGGDQGAIITIDNPQTKRVEVVKFITGTTGDYQVAYTHLKSKFTPEISIKIIDRNGVPVDVDVKDTTVSVCGPALTPKEKLGSTSTQGSSVMVTVDEK